MKNGKLILVAMVVAMFASIAVVAGCGFLKLVDSDAPKKVICNSDGSVTLKVKVPGVQLCTNEAQPIIDSQGCTKAQAEAKVQSAIRAGATVKFRNESGNFYSFYYNKWTDEIIANFYGNQIPEVGSFCGAVVYTGLDTHDGAVWFIPVSGTRKPESPVPGASISEGIFAFSECVNF